MVVLLAGFVTGPLQARALGPDGRGMLAAILLPLNVAPTILSLGLGTYLIRQAARGRSLAVLMGSVGSLLILLGAAAAAASPFVADLFAGGRDVVHQWVLIGFVLMPLSMLSWALIDLANGLERWSTVVVVRVIPPVTSVVAMVALYVSGHLTVEAAAVVSIGGGLLALVPLLSLLREMGRPRFVAAVAGDGVRFGFKAWLGGLGSLANVRLDQILMTRLVSSRELGLYVVAVTVSSFFVNPVLSAMTSGLAPRFAGGDGALVARVLRTTVLAVTIVGAAIAALTPLMVEVLFGSAFRDSIPMAWILIAGSVPLAGVSVMSTAMTLGGHPGYSATSEIIALAITVPALIIFLPAHGAIAAALISLVAYSANCGVLLFGARRRLGVRWSELLIIRRSDVEYLVGFARSTLRRVPLRRGA